jgi:hypothetical protein
MTENEKCPLCGRNLIPGPSVDRHHLIPKLKGGKDADPVHRICHGKIHSIWSENQLRDEFNTWEKIRADQRIQDFVQWVRKKPDDFVDSNKLSNNHKKKRR